MYHIVIRLSRVDQVQSQVGMVKATCGYLPTPSWLAVQSVLLKTEKQPSIHGVTYYTLLKVDMIVSYCHQTQ